MPLSKSQCTYRAALYKYNINEDGTPKAAIMLSRDKYPEEGISLDCDGGREEIDIVESQKEFFDNIYGIFRLLISDIETHSLFLTPEPSKRNKFHCELFQDENKTVINDITAYKLCSVLQRVMID